MSLARPLPDQQQQQKLKGRPNLEPADAARSFTAYAGKSPEGPVLPGAKNETPGTDCSGRARVWLLRSQ
jgi:hypothetical protein